MLNRKEDQSKTKNVDISSSTKKGIDFGGKKAIGSDITGFTEAQVQLLRRDFGEFSDKLLDIYRERNGEPQFKSGEGRSFWDMQFGSTKIYPGSIVWFGDDYGRDYRTNQTNMVGTPADYVQIEGDYEKIKGFVKGKLEEGKGSRQSGHDEVEVDPANYIIWLYRRCQDAEFKKSLEKAVVELMEGEFSRQYARLDIESEVKKLKEDEGWGPFRFHRNEDLQMTLFRLGLEYPESDEDKKFREYAVSEFKKTERPITLEEYLEQFAGKDEEKREAYATGEPARRYTIVHLEETPDEFREKLRDWCINSRAKEAAVREFRPQFNLLAGLLKTIWEVGRSDNGFAGAYPLLKNKAETGFLMNAPTLDHGTSCSDIFTDMLHAMIRVQQGAELRRFWLEGMQNDENPERVMLYVIGLLEMHKELKERRSEIPEIMQTVGKRKVTIDQEKHYLSGLGFVVPVNLLEQMVGAISKMCFKNCDFHHIDMENSAFRFLLNASLENGAFRFGFAKYTQGGSSFQKASLDLKTNSVSGNSELENVMRAYMDERGYPITDKLHVTSLEGKANGKSLVSGEDLDGGYEGIIGLNKIKVAFGFDPKSDALLISVPINSGTPFSVVKSSQSKKMMGAEEAAKELSEAKHLQFLKVGEVGSLLDGTAKKKREERIPIDNSYLLSGALNDEVSPAIAQVIKHVLVERGEGLWK